MVTVWAVAALLVAVCQSGSPVRIIGGSDASPGQLPWQVAVEITTSSGKSLCGGSLISATHVLTAGHCMRSLQDNNQNQARHKEEAAHECD